MASDAFTGFTKPSAGLSHKGTTMPKAEWGTKRICPTTGKRFYDLNKTPIVSPYTGEVVDIESHRRKLSSTVAATRAAPDKAKVVADDLDNDDDDLLAIVETDDSDDDDDLLEDDGDDTVSLDDLADVSSPDDDS
jgi:uncharacterized protein (TIGR02300 family)